MSRKWPTKEQDLRIAHLIMDKFSDEGNDELGLFEIVVDPQRKRMNLRLAHWVLVMTEQFKSMYGARHGDFVTRQVLSDCITHGETIH